MDIDLPIQHRSIDDIEIIRLRPNKTVRTASSTDAENIFLSLTNKERSFFLCSARAGSSIAELARQLGCTRQETYRKLVRLKKKHGGNYDVLLRALDKFDDTKQDPPAPFPVIAPSYETKAAPKFKVTQTVKVGKNTGVVMDVLESRSRLNGFVYLVKVFPCKGSAVTEEYVNERDLL